MCFFFKYTATTEIYTLSLHDPLPISRERDQPLLPAGQSLTVLAQVHVETARMLRDETVQPELPQRIDQLRVVRRAVAARSEEHTSELQSRQYLVCRLLLEKKKQPTLT